MLECSDIRKQWDEAFDTGRSPSRAITQHLSACSACECYTETALETRNVLRAFPLGPVNDGADQALLTSLRSERAPDPAVRRPVLSLVFAGAGSFGLTMIVAGIMLSAASGTPEPVVPSGPSGFAAKRTAAPPDSSEELDDWLTSPGLVTGSRAYRPVATPAGPQKRRNLRGQNIPPPIA